VFGLAALLLAAAPAAAQPPAHASSQITVYHDFVVKDGKSDEWLAFVKAAGAPVRDKLLAEGVIKEWALEAPLVRLPGEATHTIWYVVNDFDGVAKERAGIAEMLGKPVSSASSAKGGRTITNTERLAELVDMSKTRDFILRDVENGYGTTTVPSGAQIYTRYISYKVKPGQGRAFRRAFDKYNKPILDKLVAEGSVLAWGLSMEELKTTSYFTHVLWISTADLAGNDKVRGAVVADRDRRSEDEQDAIATTFADLTDPDAGRAQIAQTLIFRTVGQK
jgi:hypothetical protein